MKPLRDEVKEVTSELGWTKDAVDKMYKLDSFIRESLRVNGLATRKSLPGIGTVLLKIVLTLSLITVSMQRTVIKPDGMTFSNGVTLPYGTLLSVPERAIHDDPGKICQI